MNRISKVSRVLRVVFLAIIILMPVINALVWINLEKISPIGLAKLFPSLPLDDLSIRMPLSAQTRVLGFLVMMIPTGIHMLAFFLLFRLFGLYARGEIFTEHAVGYIRKAGYTLLAVQAINPLHGALISLVLTMQNPAGMRAVSVGINSTDISGMIIAFLVVLVSWIMDEGRKLKEEESLVI